MSEKLIELQNVVVLRRLDPRLLGLFGGKPVRALDGISLSVGSGETLGIMGGSGAGKTTLGELLALRLSADRGRVLVQGQDAGRLGGDERKRLRRKFRLIPQDARESLNMEQTVTRQFQELLRHAGLPESEDRITGALEQVGLGYEFLRRTPAEMSGGEQQRLAIARALVTAPLLVVGDEPVSGVDPHLRAELLRLLARYQRERNTAFLVISQDRLVISRLTQRTAMLCGGRLIEVGPTEAILTASRHPYSRLFLGQESGAMPADEDQAGSTGGGCPWAKHCSSCKAICHQQMPGLQEIAPGHQVACHAV